ncbi:hypothetical protein [Flavobacterium ginsengiterrae]|uniref:Uncharacterized protein n=1 Tax=Flavobacterium ginsengiterrae TaxID=871695 RepID=A0ABP7GAC7_9FLAO
MNSENIKILRSKISIPLNKAIELLKKNNGDVELSEKDFHNENIIEICKTTDCDKETATKEYQICNYDVVKTIERINQKPVKIETGKYSAEKIGFVLWPANEEGHFFKTAKRNDAFIPWQDFEIVITVFESVFPFQNYKYDRIEDGFDRVGHNFFNKKTSEIILEKLKIIEGKDEQEKAFLAELINWFDDKLTYAHHIIVYGNL